MFKMAKTIVKSLISKPYTRRVQREPFIGARGHIEIDVQTCTFCGACSKQCPVGAIEVIREDNSWEIDRFKCITCEYCVEKCPKKCLGVNVNYTRAGKEKTKYKAIRQKDENN